MRGLIMANLNQQEAMQKILDNNRKLIQAAKTSQKKMLFQQRLSIFLMLTLSLMIGYFVILTTITSDKVNLEDFKTAIAAEENKRMSETKSLRNKLSAAQHKLEQQQGSFEEKLVLLNKANRNLKDTFTDKNSEHLKLISDISNSIELLNKDQEKIAQSVNNNKEIVKNLSLLQESLNEINKRIHDLESIPTKVSSHNEKNNLKSNL